ncbi:hypothetical protein SADUNF_Sadunf02G0002400 [Salix dunnii]|uniref:PIN-like protein n=1 Tax=Salix dunnii TaxID=1413687 RepID=A0A835TEP6_9ROSI|nr:hypothetical protein SADUNF_Sadunf02G0002400 [Salix dunnii]
MGLLDLLIASSIPVLKVLLITAIGSYLALDHVDVLGEDARKHVNNVVFYVFNPALVSSNLAETITYDSMKKMWFMPFNILITFVIGSILGWIVVQFTRPPSYLHGLIVGCCAAAYEFSLFRTILYNLDINQCSSSLMNLPGNLGDMFLIMIPAICKEKGSPFGSPDICETFGLGYVSLSMAIGAVYLWSYVFNIVRASSVPSDKQLDKIHVGESSIETPESELRSCKEPLLASENQADRYALRSSAYDGKDEMAARSGLKQKIMVAFGNINWKSLFAPSTIGAIVGLIIGVIPLTRKLMVGNDAPLRVIQDSASLLGDGAIPALNLIMGANLLKGLRGPGVQKSVIFGIIVARYIALPLIGIFIVRGALRFGFIPRDPLYQFILLLQFAVPPAMNMGTITQLFGAGETECSVIILWAYALASISLTLWSTFFMWLVA